MSPTETPYELPRTPLLRLSDVAELLDVSTRTVLRIVSAGELESVRIGRALRFAPEDIDALIESSKKNERPGRHPDARETVTADLGDGRGER